MERRTDKRLAIPPGQWREVTHEEARELKEIPVPPTRDLYYRLSQIEDILGDEYDLDELREMVQAKREGRCVILPKEEPLKRGMTIWYVDTDTGEIEEGEVFSTDYKDGRLDSFSVDFKFSGDFDEFLGSAWGSCFFGSRERAQAALRREQDG